MSSTPSSVLDFEERLGKEDGHLDITLWFGYLELLINNNNNNNNSSTSVAETCSKKEINTIFERALRVFPHQSIKLWNWYLEERVEQHVHHHHQQHSSPATSSVVASSFRSIFRLFERSIESIIAARSDNNNNNNNKHSSTNTTNNKSNNNAPILSILTRWLDFIVACSAPSSSSLERSDQIKTVILLAQKLLHPLALSHFLRHCLANTKQINSAEITGQLLLWILKVQQHQHQLQHQHQQRTSKRNIKIQEIKESDLLLPKIQITSLFKIIRATWDELLQLAEEQEQEQQASEVYESVLNCAMESLSVLVGTLSPAIADIGDAISNSNNKNTNLFNEQLSELLGTSSKHPQSVPFRHFLLATFIPTVCKSLDHLHLPTASAQTAATTTTTTTTTSTAHEKQGKNKNTRAVLCQRFASLVWTVQQQQQNATSGGEENALSSISPSSLFCPCVVSVASCLSRFGEFAAAKNILRTSLEHASSDDQVQTLYICLLALNRESSSVATTTRNANEEDEENITADDHASVDDEDYSDLSQEALQREIVAWRTTRNPSDPANWLELISLSMKLSEKNSSFSSSASVLNDELFQRAITACTQDAALELQGVKNKYSSTKDGVAPSTRPVHLFLAYAAWLEQKFLRLPPQHQHPRYATAAVELLKRAVMASAVSSPPIIYSYSDRLILLQAAAECILRTYHRCHDDHNYPHSSTYQAEGMVECISFLAEVCGDARGDNAASPITASLLPAVAGGDIAAPLWSMRVELLLALGQVDDAVDVCWRAMKAGACSAKLILVVADALVARGVEIAENQVVEKLVREQHQQRAQSLRKQNEDAATVIVSSSSAPASYQNSPHFFQSPLLFSLHLQSQQHRLPSSHAPSVFGGDGDDDHYQHHHHHHRDHHHDHHHFGENNARHEDQNLSSTALPLLCSQTANYDYSLRAFAQTQKEGVLVTTVPTLDNANEENDDDDDHGELPLEHDKKTKNQYEQHSPSYSLITTTTTLPPLPVASIALFEKASRLVHSALDVFTKFELQSSTSNSSDPCLFTLYAVAFHMTLFLSSLITSRSSSGRSSGDKIINSATSDDNYSLEMLRQLHRSAISPLSSSANPALSLLARKSWFALGMVEWDRGLNANAIEAFRKVCEIELALADANTQTGVESSAATFPFALRQMSKVLLSSVSASSSSSSSATNIQLFINLVESLMKRAPSVQQLLRFGMQMVMYLIAISSPSSSSSSSSSTSTTENKDYAKDCLRVLAEFEDPRIDDSGVWKAWEDYVIRMNDEGGFHDLTRFKRDCIKKRIAQEEETIVVDDI